MQPLNLRSRRAIATTGSRASAWLAVLLTLGSFLFAACESAPQRLIFETTLGTFEAEIFEAEAPITAANFLRLADGGHLDGATFYRTVSPSNDNGDPPIAVIQGGLGDAPGPFGPIPHETTATTGLAHLDGSLSMARAAPGTASTEFFICIGSQPALDYGGERNADGLGFAVFGRVVSGMETVRAIHSAPSDAPTEFEYFRGQLIEEPVRIVSVRRASR